MIEHYWNDEFGGSEICKPCKNDSKRKCRSDWCECNCKEGGEACDYEMPF